jgi:ribosomal-protein-alanine N-acetyltransferase
MLRRFKQVLQQRRKRKKDVYVEKELYFSGQRLIFRHLESKDIEEVLRLELSLFQDIPLWTKTVFEIELQNRLPHLYLIGHNGENIVAFIGVRVKNFDAHITTLGVRADYQGMGIAKFLLDEAKQIAKEQKCWQISLEVQEKKENARKVYENYGFRASKIMEHYYDWYNNGVFMTYYLGAG